MSRITFMSDHPITSWLDHLHTLLPATHISLVGAGNGRSPWVQWILQCPQPPNANLIEADSEQYRLLTSYLANQSKGTHARALNRIVASEAGESCFYTANLSTESGLVSPDRLRALWPNLQVVQENTIVTSTLQDMLGAELDGNEGNHQHAWLMIDCLPAAALLRGAGSLLTQTDVVLARVLVPQDERVPMQLDDANLEDVRQLLPGMQQVALQYSRHPAIAHALFVRNPRAVIQLHTQANEGLQVKLAAEVQTATVLRQKLERAIQARQELQTDLERQGQDAQVLQARLDAEIQSKTELQQKWDQAIQLKQELETELSQRIRSVQELQAQVDAEIRSKTELQQKMKQGTQLLQELKTELAQRTQSVQELQAKLDTAIQFKTESQQKMRQGAEIQQKLEADLAHMSQITKELKTKLEDGVRSKAELQKKLDQVVHAKKKLEENFSQKTELRTLFKKQTDELISLRKYIDASLKKEATNLAKQIEATVGLLSYFATGDLPNINVERQAWPVSPDFAFYMVDLLERNNYDLIVEFGSGISTVIIARTIEKMSSRRGKRAAVKFVSFDHLENYYQQTREYLALAGVQRRVQLQHAPLEDWQASDGNVQPYYSCQSILAALSEKYFSNKLRMLVVVDGPPAPTSKHARYPAGPLILEHFAGASIDLFMDDYIREDEKEITQRWLKDITDANLKYTLTELKFEKDACLVKIRN